MCGVVDLLQLTEFTLENPADVPAVVQLVPLSMYPNVQSLLDAVPSLIPPDVVADLIVGANDDDDGIDVFTLKPDGISSVTSLRRAAETMLGMHSGTRTIALLMPAKSKVSFPVAFEPRDELPRSSLIIIRWAKVLWI